MDLLGYIDAERKRQKEDPDPPQPLGPLTLEQHQAREQAQREWNERMADLHDNDNPDSIYYR